MGVMAVLDTATERGLLMLRPSPRPGWDTVDSMATVVWVLVMAVMAMVDSDTAMERGLLMLRLSPRPMPGTDMVAFTAMVSQLMAATAMDLDSMARSKQNQIPRLTISYNTPNDLTNILE